MSFIIFTRSVKFINVSEAMLKLFNDYVELTGLKKKMKLIIYFHTRWNSTFCLLFFKKKVLKAFIIGVHVLNKYIHFLPPSNVQVL